MTQSLAESRPGARFFGLIPCAGQGSRAGAGDGGSGGQAKQYRVIAGRALVLHTLAAFLAVRRLSRTLVVVSPGDRFFDMAANPSFDVAACGGATRASSVRQGLDALASAGALPDDWVLVHDAARCLITLAQIDRLIDACQDDEVGGLLACPLADTLKTELGGRACGTLPREGKWLAQTPQMFRLGLLMRALDAADTADTAVTDESSAVEALGLSPKLVAGSPQNFKVTYPDDFSMAEAILLGRSPDVKQGSGS